MPRFFLPSVTNRKRKAPEESTLETRRKKRIRYAYSIMPRVWNLSRKSKFRVTITCADKLDNHKVAIRWGTDFLPQDQLDVYQHLIICEVPAVNNQSFTASRVEVNVAVYIDDELKWYGKPSLIALFPRSLLIIFVLLFFSFQENCFCVQMWFWFR
jgi:hypothetical protein